jgi:hypothetical protein
MQRENSRGSFKRLKLKTLIQNLNPICPPRRKLEFPVERLEFLSQILVLILYVLIYIYFKFYISLYQ